MMRRKWADPEFREMMSAALKGAAGRKKHADQIALIEVPAWVPAHFVDAFWRVALEKGEEAAASHVRKLKAALK